MKVLKSHRDNYFHQWNVEDWADGQGVSHTRFDYISVKNMQRGDGTVHNADLLEALRESMPRDGMISPLILVSVHHKHWETVWHTHFWKSIPFIIHTGNNRYGWAIKNGYTHISSILLGVRVDPRTWNYLQDELKQPISTALNLDKGTVFTNIGEWEWEG